MGRAIAAAACAVVMMAAAAAAATGEFSAGNWKGGAFFKDDRFTHCAMLQTYINGWRLLFSTDRTGEISFGLYHLDHVDMIWRSNAEVLLLDDTPVLRRGFTTANRHLVTTKFPASSEWIARLRKGDKLKINTGKHTPSFSLADINEALTALMACQAKYKTT